MFKQAVLNKEHIQELVGIPGIIAQNKVVDEIDKNCRQFIALSPLVIISTSNKDGKCDSSPRGDHPDFVKVWDSKTLLIPERPGNKRTDSMLNILDNPHIGLLFVIPGLQETLRVNGKAAIYHDPELQLHLWPEEKSPLCFLSVEVEECYVHCGKSFKRSKIWDINSWPDVKAMPSPAKIMAEHASLPSYDEKKVQEALYETYSQRMY
jgi:PPOX class probable FMN-dependent enzyme